MRRMARNTPTERDQEYKRQVRDYLSSVSIGRQWSQSEIARRVGVHPSSVNKAFKGKHAMDFSRLMVLEEQSGMPIPGALTAAYKALSAPIPRDAQTADLLGRISTLTGELIDAKIPAERDRIKQELADLLGRIG